MTKAGARAVELRGLGPCDLLTVEEASRMIGMDAVEGAAFLERRVRIMGGKLPAWALCEAHDENAAKRLCPDEYVYVIRCGECVKVGKARDPRVRLGDLQVGNPHELELLEQHHGGWWLEAELHRALDGFHVRGEWFRWCADSRRIITRTVREWQASL